MYAFIVQLHQNCKTLSNGNKASLNIIILFNK